MSAKSKSKPTLVENLQARAESTPDFNILRYRTEIPVFIYDDIRRFERRHRLLNGAEYIGGAMTMMTSFNMKIVNSDKKEYPVVFKEKSDLSRCIKGEMFLVGPQHILSLDGAQDRGVFMDRIMEKFYLIDQTWKPGFEKHKIPNHPNKIWTSAFMYIGIPDMFDNFEKRQKVSAVSQAAYTQLEKREFYEYMVFDRWPDDEDILSRWEHNYGGGPY